MVKIIFLLLIIIKSYCNIFKELNDSNLDELVKNGMDKSWLIMFYLEKCSHCINAKDVLSKLVNKENFNPQVGIVECTQNIFSCMRFNITRVPYIILIENNKMFEFNTYATEHSLIKFISEEKNVDNALNIPSKIGYLEFFFKLIGEGINMINDYLKNYVKDSLKIDIEWNMYYTIVIFIILLIIVIIIEYMILSFCFYKSKRGKQKNDVVHQKNE